MTDALKAALEPEDAGPFTMSAYLNTNQLFKAMSAHIDKMKSENELMRRLLEKAIEQRDSWTWSRDDSDEFGESDVAKDDAELIAIVQEWKTK